MLNDQSAIRVLDPFKWQPLTVVGWALLILLLFLLMGMWRWRRVQGMLRHLTEVTLSLADGEFQRRAKEDGVAEIKKLAKALNALAHNAEKELRRVHATAEKFQAVLGSLRDGVILIDNKESIELINLAAAEMLGFGVDVAIGKKDTLLVRHPELSDLLRQARSEGSACYRRIMLSGQAVRHIRAAVLPLEGRRILIVLQDLTDVYTAVDIRRDFVANVSHELRTPLTSLGLLIENLLGGAIDEREVAEDFLKRMANEILRLNVMVLELLQLSRLESGQEELLISNFRAHELVQEALSSLAGLLLNRKQEILYEGEQNAVFSADREKLKQVVINLLDNASKFSPEGAPIVIGLRENANEVELYVRDRGAGVLPEHLPRVYERFFKGSASRGGGTGLGLAIAKHIIESHGGAVYVRSRFGEGATFGFTLPKKG